MTAMVLDVDGLDALLARLREATDRVIGPVARDGAVVYEDIGGVDDLPRGIVDEQGPGHYRIEHRDDEQRFGYAVGPHSWKRYLFPPSIELMRARRTDDGAFAVDPAPAPTGTLAFVGARACELHAIAIQDRVFAHDADYQARRANIVVVGVQCGAPAATCFCPSTGSGPDIGPGLGADVVLTEVLDGGGHRFVARADTDRGTELLRELPGRPATETDAGDAEAVLDRTRTAITRTLAVTGLDLRDLLAATLEHDSWDEVAQRCLSCANCTLACPTCFCSAVDDVTDLDGEATRVRRWDSCFTGAHSYIHGGSVHADTRSRYRQWLTHKLGTWWDQFDTSGCVGCGRCITWCPVGIDLTAQVRALTQVEVR